MDYQQWVSCALSKPNQAYKHVLMTHLWCDISGSLEDQLFSGLSNLSLLGGKIAAIMEWKRCTCVPFNTASFASERDSFARPLLGKLKQIWHLRESMCGLGVGFCHRACKYEYKHTWSALCRVPHNTHQSHKTYAHCNCRSPPIRFHVHY